MLGVIVLASAGLRSAAARIGAYVAVAGGLLFLGFAGVLAAAAGITAGRVGATGYGAGVLATAAAAGALLVPGRSLTRRYLGLDPGSPVDALAVALIVVVVGSELASQLSSDVVGAAGAAAPLRPLDLVAQEIPFLLAALLGVGLLTRRGGRDTLRRIGFVVPRPWHLLVGIAVAGLLYALGNLVDALGHRFTPDQATHVEQATRHIFGGLQNPAGIAALAIAPGVCEEALFRGALQPRVGIAVTAIVFAAVHTQYGLSFDLAAVLLLAVILGVVRRVANTTTSALAHTIYNGLVAVGLPGLTIWLAGGVEAAAIAVLGVAGAIHLRRRRGRPQSA